MNAVFEQDDRDYIGNSGLQKMGRVNDLQEEVLDILKEECGELIQAASKINRCGMDFVPSDSDITAKQQFTSEVGDVLLLINEAFAAGLIDVEALRMRIQSKPEKLRIWTTHLGNADPDALPGTLGC